MRNCLKTCEAKQYFLPSSKKSGRYVKSPRFWTVDLEPSEFTKVSAWGYRPHVA